MSDSLTERLLAAEEHLRLDRDGPAISFVRELSTEGLRALLREAVAALQTAEEQYRLLERANSTLSGQLTDETERANTAEAELARVRAG